ncbi:glutamate/tyrosine decarboxylase-like PLP-dependent enzyme [Azospirillum sp. OGB3]|uniref:pyridoxal phosphate-dependent decarboxylase family protein n=1 Tax=Azospirillum sp. OGB3 TaxID=2587012 RepID=UPI00184E4966|nr:pyridoxal-dependent decarboxylase [Azospirillum sp. OGB3]MBB3265210.1 glutamate/tyrosine decarboxylase-like PLP-dependent enzyme [Azospirillum sp. OGB3]
MDSVMKDRARQGFAALLGQSGAPHLRTAGSRAVEAWFLGPKGENAELLEALLAEAVRDQAHWRRNYRPGDPTHITEAIKRSPEYLAALDALNAGYRELLAFLKKSVPFFSMRYQGHMNWDLTIPGIVGYFAAMLYNPNNVAFEGSTATTLLELLVGDDLCRMLGYSIPEPHTADAVRPWGHITCDGSVANIEAMWSARNLRFYPLALRRALATSDKLADARDVDLPVPQGGRARLRDLGPWELMNLNPDEVLKLPRRFAQEFGIASQTVSQEVAPFGLQTLGLPRFAREFLAGVPDPVIFVPGTKHYSFPKAGALLGLGAGNLIDIPVDNDARLDVDILRERLEACLQDRRPVIAVVGVVGTTEESAIDPLDAMADLRDALAGRGLVVHLHVDAAWGGYHRSTINEPFDMPRPSGFNAPPPAVPLSRYAERHMRALDRADSITVDPHKSGYIPYPAGALCYRNGAMRHLVAFSAPVVFHGEAEPTVGIYGVEGSKPGAAAAAVYLSHRVIRPTIDGYGRIIGQALFSCRKLYARLLSLARPDDPFIVVPVPRLPAERSGASDEVVVAERKRIREVIDLRSGDEIRADPTALDLLREIGPDQNILSYAFNFRLPDGAVNGDLALMNALNQALYKRLSIDPGHDIHGYDLIVSTTDLVRGAYGSAFIDDMKRRLGVAGSEGDTITVLRSVIMDPWVTETDQGSFIDVLERELRRAILEAVETVRPTQTRGL